jgi:hypothetical protein
MFLRHEHKLHTYVVKNLSYVPIYRLASGEIHIVEDLIVEKKVHVTGGKGNPHYAKQLNSETPGD